MASRAALAAAARALFSEPSGRAPAQWTSLAWPEYLRRRGWLGDRFDSADEPAKQAAVGLLSSALTFPLTIASHWQELGGGASDASLCVVGARAESTLPQHVWQELALLLPDTSLRLEFTGPKADAPPRASKGGPLILEHGHRGLFHEGALGRSLLRQRASPGPAEQASAAEVGAPDAYVLFNPGLGEPGWEKAWGPTLRALAAARRPLLLTALSARDGDRDAAFVQEAAPELAPRSPSAGYAPNQFRSELRAATDGGDEAAGSNWVTRVFRAE